MRSYHGFLYKFEAKLGNNNRWRCKKRTCRAKLITGFCDEIISVGIPIHSEVQEDINNYICKNKLKELTLTTRENSSRLVTDITRDFNDNEVVDHVERKVLINLINSERNNIPNFIPSIPVFPECIRKNHLDEIFLIFYSNESYKNIEYRFVIFS
ncbi:hypothetical protein DMUE_6201 [Dictyocoela muelleri]|nr:hypothetical protein DMUE_6201 [Dictyocoela muelleri]